MEWGGTNVAHCSHPKAFTPKVIGCKLRSGAYLQEGLKQKDVKQELHSLISERKRPFAGYDTMNFRLIGLLYTQDTR